MSPAILSHYSVAQFFLITLLLISFIGLIIHGFLSVYYSRSKTHSLFLWLPYLLLILTAVQVETSYEPVQGKFYIILFRIISSLSLLLLIYLRRQKREKRYTICILWMLTICLASFLNHYLPLYLTALYLPIIISVCKRDKSEVNIRRNAFAILQDLKEAVLILSVNREILMINNQMRSLLKLDSDERLSLETIGERIFNKQNLLDKLIQKQESGHCIRETESSALLINYTFVPSKGIIFTASDITESKELQKSIKKRISYLETLNSQLLNFSERTEALRITEERKGLILNIQKLVKDGMTEIQNLLNSISDEPPESYDYILKCCRSVLNEIRLIVTNWRSLGRDEK